MNLPQHNFQNSQINASNEPTAPSQAEKTNLPALPHNRAVGPGLESLAPSSPTDASQAVSGADACVCF
ncbi:hypothetical protein M427DRAFT_58941 [Gonapodya prolifera JEL478]|uniref:Uncharacterized protein n=1 Tax=Gonapodya prolifera (strain JEL478) TaxID=1344416 RepID=A0A139A8K9_GONPJ|nr:hypothetical protein M427DRAFT_58941 [Gonapodya prolifera JEL478]|eukprot:KXS13018.1 hypothetical protein M427DRAFT_58941 [Gonapodya prolifera JEL478]